MDVATMADGQTAPSIVRTHHEWSILWPSSSWSNPVPQRFFHQVPKTSQSTQQWWPNTTSSCSMTFSQVSPPFLLCKWRVLCTINVLLGELHEKVALLITAPLAPNKAHSLAVPHIPSWSPLPPDPTWPPTFPSAAPHTNPPETPVPFWPACHLALCTTLVPVSKIIPYKKHVPAKPPFTHGHSKLELTQTKDHMHPP